MKGNFYRVTSAAILFAVGSGTALANGLGGGSLTANCDGYTVTANATNLHPPSTYTVDYSVTLSGCVSSPITVTKTIPVVEAADGKSGTATDTGTWPATLNGICTVSGTVKLTQNTVQKPIVVTAQNFTCSPPEVKGICHNIGGPRDLGANCDSNDQCTLVLQDGSTVTTDGNKFFGIIIKASPKATRAHIRHGDGPLLMTFNPPLHLASEIGPHKASNVECLGERVNAQPPEPGN